MSFTYSQVFNSTSIKRSDGVIIPDDPNNREWQEYTNWLSQGNKLEPLPLSTYKDTQKALVGSSCKTAIVGGFTSNATGNVLTYPSDTVTQMNITMMATSGSGGAIWCKNSANNWSFLQHTAANVLQVQKDMNTFIQTQQTKYSQLLTQIDAATTIEQIQSIIW